MSGTPFHPYADHVDDVYGYLAYRHGSRVVAEALTRATFERVFRDGGAVGRDSRGPRIALIALAREARADDISDRAPDDDSAVPVDLAVALDRVERGERAVLALRFGARLRGPEIAALLDVEERRVRQLLSRGLRRLRTELERERGGDGEQNEA